VAIHIHIHHHEHDPDNAHLAEEISALRYSVVSLRSTLMAKSQEVIDTLNAVAEKQKKTIAEIQSLQSATNDLKAKIAELEEQVTNGDIPQEVVDKVAEVKKLADQVDDEIPDVTPVEVPA
jgi:seryl-tRNA synthetase